MRGLGTFINCFGVLVGGALGLCLRKGLDGRYRSSLITVCGLSTLFLGIAGTLEEMLAIKGGVLASHKTMMILFSLVPGAITGEALNIEKHIEEFGHGVKLRSGSGNDACFVDGFVSTSLTICIGAMAVVGSIEDGLNGDFSTLAAKAVLDLIIVLVLTSSLGKGCIFAVIPLGLFQGSVTLLAGVIGPLLTAEAVSNLSLVGSMLIFCVGVNLMFDKKIRVANLLPSLLFAVGCAFIPLKILK